MNWKLTKNRLNQICSIYIEMHINSYVVQIIDILYVLILTMHMYFLAYMHTYLHNIIPQIIAPSE